MLQRKIWPLPLAPSSPLYAEVMEGELHARTMYERGDFKSDLAFLYNARDLDWDEKPAPTYALVPGLAQQLREAKADAAEDRRWKPKPSSKIPSEEWLARQADEAEANLVPIPEKLRPRLGPRVRRWRPPDNRMTPAGQARIDAIFDEARRKRNAAP